MNRPHPDLARYLEPEAAPRGGMGTVWPQPEPVFTLVRVIRMDNGDVWVLHIPAPYYELVNP